MPSRLLSSFSLQISAAFLSLLLLFAAANLYTLGVFQRQIAYDRLVDIAGRLQLSAQQLQMQAMNYEQNAPKDYATYSRDVRLYYQDLMSHVHTFDRVVEDFMRWDFGDQVVGFLPWLQPSANAAVAQAVTALEDVWHDYRAGLFAALGPDPKEPRLQHAARHNLGHHQALEHAASALAEVLRLGAAAEHRRVVRISLLLVLVAGTILTLVILAILYVKTLRPLNRTIAGMTQIAEGDFGHRVPIAGASEIRQLITSFNNLSGRLDVLFKLIERLQRGNDLDEVIRFLSQEFPELLRIDWIGVVFFSADRASARLEISYLDGKPEMMSRQPYLLKETLLERALRGGAPLHIDSMRETAAGNPRFEFLRSLVNRGFRDAIFLPLTPQTLTPIPAVLVFATRREGSYDEAHLKFLDNIAQLITHSFGRTVRLAEHGRLAAIGEFASGIAHELRTPLNTITLALEHLAGLELEEPTGKRVRLARREATRMGRLLEDILLYAKPLDLDLRPLCVTEILSRFVESHRDLALARKQSLTLKATNVDAHVVADEDRLIQILHNLTQNACEAAPQGARITWTVGEELEEGGAVVLEIRNPGEPIPAETLPRLTEPFFSTKAAGTGLGLAIVQRLILVHGGTLSFTSDDRLGTCARVILPSMPKGSGAAASHLEDRESSDASD